MGAGGGGCLDMHELHHPPPYIRRKINEKIEKEIYYIKFAWADKSPENRYVFTRRRYSKTHHE